MWIKSKVSDKSGKELEDVRINFDDVRAYRRWRSKDGSNDKTIIYYKDKTELIIDLSVEQIDTELKACNYLMA